jgi:hypothetical protein
VLLVAIGGFLLSGSKGGSTARSGPGYCRSAARHEAGHAAVIRHLGGRVTSARVHADGSGLTRGHWPGDAVSQVAVFKAGQYADGSSAWSPRNASDEDVIRSVLRQVPARDRAEVRRQGERLARQGLAARAGQISRDARRLEKRGWL